MSKNVRAHAIVSGVVHTVGFRSFTVRLANEYGLCGWVRNMPDGSVEIEVEGNRGLVLDFVEEVRVGPPAARVTAVDVQWGSYTGEYKEFHVKF